MALRDATYERERYRLSALTRRVEKPQKPIELLTSTIAELLSRSPAPSNPFDVIDRLLLHVHANAPSLTGYAKIRPADYPLFTLRSPAELDDFLKQMKTLGYTEGGVDKVGLFAYRPTLKGWERIDHLRRTGRKSAQAFVAMWFADEMEPAWRDGVVSALTDAGWDPFRIDRVEHNDKIDDRIVAEIRRSGLLVADFTGQRGGVYFEAGLATGLGLPVIWTVRESDFEAVHFDTRQYNHIVWKTPEELRARLHDRVLATVNPPQRDVT
jgi:nucleoside 2-deoxyribosyltransferase